MRRATGLILFLAVTLSTAAAAGEARPAVSLTSYWRYWVTHKPPVLSEPFVDKRGRKHAELAPARGWHIYGQVRSISTAGPASGWEKADFDDSRWPAARMPVLTGQGQSFWDQPVTARRLAARARFEVPDPAAVRKLKLTVRYRGGLTVYLNGREVARGHLPKGELKPDAFAQGYPKGAYMPADKEEAKAGKKLTYFGMWTYTIFWGWKDKPALKALAGKVRKRRERLLDVEIPAGLLKKGVNVLSIDARQAALASHAYRWNWGWDQMNGTFWGHLHVKKLHLVSEPAGAARPVSRPSGTQLWGEDLHRWVFNADFLEPGAKAPPVKIVAARNGTFSGQAVLGTSGLLGAIEASVTDLTGPGKIPASAVRVRYGRPTSLPKMLENYGKGALRPTFPDQAIIRYAPSLGLGKELAEAVRRRRVLGLAGRTKLSFFDRLSDSAPAKIPAGSCQTIWLTVKVPKGAAPGAYKGRLTVRAAGMAEKSLDVNIEVSGYTLPPPRDWTTLVGIEESPYSVAEHYKLPLWSEAHWKRIGECFTWLGALGNNVVQVPLIAGTGMGNAESMVTWVQKGDAYEYDWKVLDRYVGMARRHCGKPLALVALVHPPVDMKKGRKLAVTVSEGGKRRRLELPAPGTPEWRKLWVPFAKAFVAHVREKKLADSVHWGIFYDRVPLTLMDMAGELAKEIPGTGWIRSSHDGNRRRPFPKASKARVNLDTHIRGFSEPDWSKGGLGRKGWARKDLNLLYPREASQITAIPAYAPLWHLRELPELAITSDARGFSRLAANYWDRSAGGWFVPAVLYILYPGEAGVEGSVQLEALREGLQECEARIAVERRRPETPILKERVRCAWLLPGGTSHGRTGEFHGGWQERSRKLYEAAARTR